MDLIELLRIGPIQESILINLSFEQMVILRESLGNIDLTCSIKLADKYIIHLKEVSARTIPIYRSIKQIGLLKTMDIAITKGDLSTVHFLLNSGFNINHQYGHSNLVGLAICKNQLELTKFFLDTNPDWLNQLGYFLHLATLTGNLEMVQFFIEKGSTFPNFSINWTEWEDRTSLMIAAKEGYVEIVKLLIENKADVHLQDTNGDAALNIAVEYGQYKISKLLIAANADVNQKDLYGDSPLHSAVEHNNLKIAKILLEAGADINGTNNEGCTPLVSQFGSVSMIQLLLKYQANVNLCDNYGQNVLMKVVLRFYLPFAKEIVELLLETDIDVNACDQDNQTVLDYAISRSSFLIIQLLIEKGAKFNTVKLEDQSPEIIALFQ